MGLLPDESQPTPAPAPPPAPPAAGARPVRLVVRDRALERSRPTVAIRLLLSIPLVLWFLLWSAVTLLVAIVAWLVVLVTARLPGALADYFSSYVRFVAHLYAYLSFAADRYPSFVGTPGYAVDVEIDPPPKQRRLSVAFRLVLALPALLFSSTLAGTGSGSSSSSGGDGGDWIVAVGSGGGAIVVVAVLGWFVSLVRGRMAAGLRDLAVYAIGYGSQLSAYLFFLTDRYPSADPACVRPPLAVPRHPLRCVDTDDGRRQRLLVALRLPLLVPHLIWLVVWSLLVGLLSPAAWLLVVVLGRLPGPLHRFFSAWARAWAQFTTFATLVANPFPGFVGAPGYPVETDIDPPRRQHRLTAFFRALLAVPAIMVASAYTGILVAAAFLMWWAALVTGRAPSGLQAIGVASIRYLAQTAGYLAFLSDRYPYASPALVESEPDAAGSATA